MSASPERVTSASDTAAREARRSVEVRSPYTRELVGEVALCGEKEVDGACAIASSALAAGRFPQHARAAVLEAAGRLLTEREDEFATRIVLESGKPIRAARNEVLRCLETLRFAAAEVRVLGGEAVPFEATSAGDGKLGLALRVPVGVVGAITPFNFPLNLVAHKLAPAIAAGCPVVLKPAPQTPLSALALVELLADAGLPEGWTSVVTDARSEAGAPLVAHHVPAAITFTGSVSVGWEIAARAPQKRVLLELGSNAPVIVAADAEVGDVASRIRVAGYGQAGQSCISVQRVIVHRSRHEEFLEALTAEVEGLVVGDPMDEATEVGPLISESAAARVASWIDDAVAGGGRRVVGGQLTGRAIVAPAIVDQPPREVDLCTQEAFGPVVVVLAYETLEEAIDIANDTRLPLQASIFTNDLSAALHAARQLDFGGVLVNETPTFRADHQPYGGKGDAGNTREGPKYAIRELTDLKVLSFQS